MSPFKVNEGAFRKQMNVNMSRPQELAPEKLPDNWLGTPNQGLPVTQIPHWEFPKVVYMHPVGETETIEHRNDKFEVVGEEIVPTEHLTKVVACDAHLTPGTCIEHRGKPEAAIGCKECPKAAGAEKGKCPDCEKALEEALAQGWTLQPYNNKFIASGDRRRRKQLLYGPKGKPAPEILTQENPKGQSTENARKRNAS